MARSRPTPALLYTPDDDFREIIEWYEHMLANTAPPSGLRWEPTKIGPTWKYSTESAWLLPQYTLGWRVLAWCGKWLRGKNGAPWQFTPEQTRFVLWYFAVDETGDFLYHSAVLQRLKGWGKDPVAACLAMAAMFAEVAFDHWDNDRPIGREEPNAWVQIVAVSQEQTKNTMMLFPSLASPEALKHYGIQVGKLNVYGLRDTRRIEAVTSSYLSIEGGRPTQIIRGETQNWNSSNSGHEMAGAIEGNAAKSENGSARMLDICNAYRPHEDSVAQRVREAWEATLADGEKTSVAPDFGLMYDSLEAPGEAPLTVEAIPEVIKAVAGDSTWLDTKPGGRIEQSILNPANPPSESRRKWFNQIGAAEEAWMSPQEWDTCARPDEAVAGGEQIVMFLDCSKSDDATALVGCRVSDGFVFLLGVWQRHPGEDAATWRVDRDAVDHAVRGAFEQYRPVALWADPSDARDDDTGVRYWDGHIDAWARGFAPRLRAMPAVATGPGRHSIVWDMRNPMHLKAFTEAAERVVSDVTDRALTHSGNQIMRQHVRNAQRRPNKFGIGIGKEHRESARKIDAAVCVVGARMMWHLYANSRQKGRTPGRGRAILLA